MTPSGGGCWPDSSWRSRQPADPSFGPAQELIAEFNAGRAAGGPADTGIRTAGYVDPVPTGINGEGVRLTMKPVGGGKVVFDPYPFDVSPLRVSVRARMLSIEGEMSEDSGLEVYQKAPREIIQFQIAR